MLGEAWPKPPVPFEPVVPPAGFSLVAIYGGLPGQVICAFDHAMISPGGAEPLILVAGVVPVFLGGELDNGQLIASVAGPVALGDPWAVTAGTTADIETFVGSSHDIGASSGFLLPA